MVVWAVISRPLPVSRLLLAVLRHGSEPAVRARYVATAPQDVPRGVAVQVAEKSCNERAGRWCAVAVEVLDRPETVLARSVSDDSGFGVEAVDLDQRDVGVSRRLRVRGLRVPDRPGSTGHVLQQVRRAPILAG